MDNTTYETEKTLKFIREIFENSEYQNTLNVIQTDSDFLNYDNLRNELKTYSKDERNTMNAIFRTSNELIELYHKHIEKLPKGSEKADIAKNIITKKDKDDFIESVLPNENIEKNIIKQYEKFRSSALIVDDEFEYRYGDHFNTYFIFNSEFFDYCNYIIEYIDSIRGQSKEKELKIEPPKQYSYNTPDLTQQQISMLFKVLNDKNVFLKDIKKEDFYNIISLLTGYSSKQYKKKISLLDLFDISESKKDYEVIINKLKDVLKVFEDKNKKL